MENFSNYILCYILLLPYLVCTSGQSVVNNVRDHGAIGDGIVDDTNALSNAWEATCNSSSSAAMQFPANLTFLTHPLTFKGPCKAKVINVEINGVITAPSEPKNWRCGNGDNKNCTSWIHFSHVDGLSIFGSGTISGSGQKWWDIKSKQKPAAFRITYCNNTRLSGLTFKDNPKMHIIIDNVNTAHVSNLMIKAPSHSPNTDGIHVGRSTGVTIEQCTIGTGDDCISIGGGSSKLRINDIKCGPGHGVSIGSLGKHGAEDKVEDIQVTDVVFTNTTNGARIKTWQGGKGYARNILFQNLLIHESDNPVIVDQFYCDHENCVDHASAVKISDITFREVLGTSKRQTAVKLDCSATVPCENIMLENIHIRSRRKGKKASSSCINARGKVLGQMVPKISLSS